MMPGRGEDKKVKLTAFLEPDGDIDGDILEVERTKPGEICNQGWKKGNQPYQSFFGILGVEKDPEPNEEREIFKDMMTLNQDTSFDYFVGKFQILPMFLS